MLLLRLAFTVMLFCVASSSFATDKSKQKHKSDDSGKVCTIISHDPYIDHSCCSKLLKFCSCICLVASPTGRVVAFLYEGDDDQGIGAAEGVKLVLLSSLCVCAGLVNITAAESIPKKIKCCCKKRDDQEVEMLQFGNGRVVVPLMNGDGIVVDGSEGDALQVDNKDENSCRDRCNKYGLYAVKGAIGLLVVGGAVADGHRVLLEAEESGLGELAKPLAAAEFCSLAGLCIALNQVSKNKEIGKNVHFGAKCIICLGTFSSGFSYIVCEMATYPHRFIDNEFGDLA